MGVYVDPLLEYPEWAIKPRARMAGRVWCHLVADTDAELHAFADQLGMQRRWFQEDARRPWANHYDLTPARRETALALGAREIDGAELVALLDRRGAGAPAPQPAPES